MRRIRWGRVALLLSIVVGTSGMWAWIQAGEKKESFLARWDQAFFNLDARAAVLVDAQTGEVLYDQDGDTPYPVASMSKMMTEYLLLEAIRDQRVTWEDKVRVSENAATAEGARISLEAGESYPLRDLYEAMAVGSANNAAVAIGEHLAGSTADFAALMNQKAEELGLKSSQFVNATGLVYSYGQNQMTARDVGRLAFRLVTDFPEIIQLTSEPRVQLASTGERVLNTNLMLLTDNESLRVPGLDGLKTGFTDEAGYCFTGTAKRGERRLISVVMGTDTEVARFTQTKKLLEKGFL
ncbi:D-alanyl-D-alanine carboxypeptidase [Brevibacillus choshinensis]|uniref:D-alanyl-D-alanine carboxypeptidase n=1 Tax=Brevibacillus choshinensis TaxID=54911 RepID=A0ABR5N834_BRECH|nr:D-alanyl-D-alanine carboxypeptidase family protein [Brevibacillus choshinensis]KQL46770.1 D-alanyl-D-alanine carboxypeptidase [Brevibacillus choshinensis]